jgi:autotransporter passenger strand-loop-strand repeat protein
MPSLTISIGGVFDESGVSYSSVTSASLNPTSDVLTLFTSHGATTVQLSGNYQGDAFGLSSDGDGGVEIANLGSGAAVDDPIVTSSTSTVEQIVILAGSNLEFDNSYERTVNSGYEDAIVAAESFYQSEIATTATLNFDFTTSAGSGPGENSYSSVSVSFAALESALASRATSADDMAAVAAIGRLSGSVTSETFQISDGLAQVLGLGGSNAPDTTVLDSTLSYFYNQSDPVAGEYDAVGILEHEISEGGFGRVGGDGSTNGITDLFRYSAPGVLDTTLGQDAKPAFFSINGTTLLTEFHDPIAADGSTDGADSADWDPSSTNQDLTPVPGLADTNDSYGAATTGEIGVVTATDLAVLDVLGWTLSSGGPATPSGPITSIGPGQGLTVAPGQTDSGLTVSGDLYVDSGGVAQAAMIAQGSLEFILSGGADLGAIVASGGEQVISTGAEATGVTVQSGGLQLTRSAALTSNTVILSGGSERFYSGADQIGLVVSSGGTFGEDAQVGAGVTSVVSTTTLTAETVVSGGATVMSGGRIVIEAAEIASGGTLAFPSGTVLPGLTTVSFGGVLSGPGVVTGDVYDDGLVSGAAVSGDAYLLVSASGLAEGLSALDGGDIEVSSGGRLSGVTLSGGDLTLDGGSLTTSVVIASGGEAFVSSGASLSGLTILGGGDIDLESVRASSAGLSGGDLVLTRGGEVVDTIVLTGEPGGLSVSASSDGAGGTFVAVTTTSAAFVAPDDFNGDGRSDILIENTGGAVVVGELGSGGQEVYAQVGGLGPEWKFVGTGDFLGAGDDQILIENTNGAVDVGAVVGGMVEYTSVAALGPEWSFVGAGDFLGDGRADFLIENSNGALFVGESFSSETEYTQVTALGPEWKFVGTGDFLGDGKTDFLIENTSGAVFVGEVANGQTQFTQVTALGPEWKFVETGDFVGDGKDDFLIENTAGAVVVGEVSGGQTTFTTVGGLGPEWSFVGAGDYAGKGLDSFLIENTNGAVFTGTVVSGQAQYAQVGSLGLEWKFHG